MSEGRDTAAIREIVEAFGDGGGRVLDVHSDRDHHRSVVTLVADDDSRLVESLLAGIARAAELVDLGAHDGIHPRVGAADVVPVVPLDAQDVGRAVAMAHAVGRRIGDELGLPVLLYGLVGEGRRPAFYRRGGVGALQQRIDDGELSPAYGPTRLDPRAGAVLVGAREPLVAFNLVLDSADVDTARAIAMAVRASGGGLPGVQAIGLVLADGSVQVSTNVIDLEVAAVHELVARVRQEAALRGVGVRESELVGLVPARVVIDAAHAAGLTETTGEDGLPTTAALAAAAIALALPDLAADRVLEWQLAHGGVSLTSAPLDLERS